MARPGKTIRWDVLNGEWTADLAWFVGMTFGDGNIFKSKDNYRVSLSGNKNEPDLINKWKNLICPEATVHKVTENGIEAYFGSRKVVEWFESNWNLCGDKMACLRWPVGKIPDKFLSHFVRGLIDTDGSLYIENHKKYGRKGNDPLKLSFSSSVSDFVEDLKKALVLLGLPEVSVSSYKKKDKRSKRIFIQYKLSWSGSSALEVADWLYRDSSPENRGDNGYRVYQEYLNLKAEMDRPCVCGKTPVLKESGLCRTCLYRKKREENPRPPCKFGCGRISEFKDICNACYKRTKRALIKSAS